jgi:hypothetical protein
MVKGFHVPVMPLLEVDGSAGAVLLMHRGPIGEKLGVILVLSVSVPEPGALTQFVEVLVITTL